MPRGSAKFILSNRENSGDHNKEIANGTFVARPSVYHFFPFIYGIYPRAAVTEKQMAAMEQADIPFQYPTIRGLANRCARKRLEDGSAEKRFQ